MATQAVQVQVTKRQIQQATKLLAGYGYVPNKNQPWFFARHLGMAIAPGTHVQHVAMANAIVKVQGVGASVVGTYTSSILHFGNATQRKYSGFANNTYKVGNVANTILAYGCSTHHCYTASGASNRGCTSTCTYGLVAVAQGGKFLHTMLTVAGGTKHTKAPKATKATSTSQDAPIAPATTPSTS